MGLHGQDHHAAVQPGFAESYYGYRSFKELVEDAHKHKLVVVVRDEKSWQYTIRLSAAD